MSCYAAGALARTGIPSEHSMLPAEWCRNPELRWVDGRSRSPATPARRGTRPSDARLSPARRTRQRPHSRASCRESPRGRAHVRRRRRRARRNRGCMKLLVCAEKRTRVIDPFIALANAIIITRRLLRESLDRCRCGHPPPVGDTGPAFPRNSRRRTGSRRTCSEGSPGTSGTILRPATPDSSTNWPARSDGPAVLVSGDQWTWPSKPPRPTCSSKNTTSRRGAILPSRLSVLYSAR